MGLEYSAFVRANKAQVIVELSRDQLAVADEFAKKRNGVHRTNNRADGIVMSGKSIDVDIDGARAELAVCVAYNLPWNNAFLPIERWDNERRLLHDVGSMEVKSTRHRVGCLLVQKQFDDAPPYVLVVTDGSPVFRLVGWLYGYEVKQPKFWRTDVRRPCYMAPQNELRSMATL